MAYYRQDGPVPDQVRFTLRVDSESNPALAELLWRMPWGARHAAVIELLELGYRAKQGGLTVPAQPAPPPARKRPTRSEAEPAPRQELVPARSALLPSPAPAPASPADTAPARPTGASPDTTFPMSADPPSAPTVTNQTSPAEPDPAPEASADDEPSAVAALLGQFGG